jgi:hypothetical protein
MKLLNTLAEVLALFTIFLFGAACFIGMIYYTLGDIVPSISVAVSVCVLSGGMALAAKLLKHTSRRFKTRVFWEAGILIALMGVMAICSCRYFTRFLFVWEQKTEIREKLMASITQAENMFAEYERYAKNRENLYRNKLRSVVAAKHVNPGEYAGYGFENSRVSDNMQIENKMFTVHADLFPSNYESMKQANTKWLADARNILDNLKMWNIGIVDIVNNVETNSNAWLSTLIKFSAVRERGEQAVDFSYNLSFDDAKKHFTARGEPATLFSALAIVITCGAYLLMIGPWFFTKRHSRFPGFKITFGKIGDGKIRINRI